MTTAGQVKAGDAWVMLHGAMGNLKEVLDKALKYITSWSGSVQMAGDQVGGKFGKTIMNGLVGAMAVGAADRALGSLVEELQKAAEGNSDELRGIGTAIVDGLVSAFDSVPIVGKLPHLIALLGDELMGGSMAFEAGMEARAKKAQSLADAYANVADEIEKIQARSRGAAANSRDDMMARASQLQTKLAEEILEASGPKRPAVPAGKLTEANLAAANAAYVDGREAARVQANRQAAEAVGELRREIERTLALDAQQAFADMVGEIDRMTGAMNADEAATARFEKQLATLRETLVVGGAGAQADTLIAGLRDRREWGLIMQRWSELDDRAAKVKESLADTAESLGMLDDPAVASLLESFAALVSDSHLSGFSAMEAALGSADEVEQQIHRLKEIRDIIDDLGAKADSVGKSLADQVADNLRSLDASPEEIARGVDAANRLELAQKAHEVQKIIDDLERQNQDSGKSPLEILESRLGRLGATPDQIDRAIQQMTELDAKEAAMRNSLSAVGSFSSGAFESGSALGAALRDSSASTARNTRSMLDLMRSGKGLVIGA